MNREVKFRAWDPFNAEMLKPHDVNGHKKDLSWFFSQYEESEKGENNPILMQYTGLKDKNNKEIYEGDIYFCYDISSNPPHKYIPQEVKWDKDFSSWNLITLEGLKRAHETKIFEYEVIGNIHQNPELLKP